MEPNKSSSVECFQNDAKNDDLKEDVDSVMKQGDSNDGNKAKVLKEKELESYGDADNEMFKKHITEEFLSTSFNEDLYITVSDPDKHVQAFETFVVYKVITKTTRSTFDSSEFVVSRRFQDFIWLKEMFENDYPTFIIPPLPSKFIVKGLIDKFTPEFIEKRCLALNKFLQRVSNHPIISYSDHLKTFLISENFSSQNKQGIVSRVTNSLKWNRVNNPQFETIADFVSLFGEKMSILDRIGERLLMEKKDLVSDLRQFGPTLNDWSGIEEESTEAVLTSVGNCVEVWTEEGKKNVTVHELELIPLVKEYYLYAEVVKQALKRRDIRQLQFEKCSDQLESKQAEKDFLPNADQSYSFGALMGKSPELVKKEKEEKLLQQIESLSRVKEELANEHAKANANLIADLERWNQHKARDLAGVLSKLASAQITYHNNCSSSWKNILSFMELPEQTREPANISLPI